MQEQQWGEQLGDYCSKGERMMTSVVATEMEESRRIQYVLWKSKCINARSDKKKHRMTFRFPV